MEKEQLIEKIKKLKQEKNALIVAHYYVDDDIQDLADYIGDSYYLSKVCMMRPEELIIFCGVRFMGESAKILNPEKTVIMAEELADCPMAHMAEVARIREVRSQYEDVAVVCYINSTTEIKALADVVVTSANAYTIVSKLPQKNIFFVPDEHLGRYISKKLPDKNFIFNDGFCHVHTSITQEAVLEAKRVRPEAEILVHPECKTEIVDMADYVGSTSGILKYATESDKKEFIICTEMGILHQLKLANPNKKFYSVGHRQFCPNMKRISIEDVYEALATERNPIHLEGNLIERAKSALENMHALAN
ncbi:quinolinate synthase NadA [Cellulosilyticum ruminicola]|uniref:quinolinate synthase NadA n=1 Tax=Cellulosilyticum ruminicola TaxID=425254 RepID=UPI0006D047D8|nr:quinolinate synthase NadA [Cellulosilyticum ruminicola]